MVEADVIASSKQQRIELAPERGQRRCRRETKQQAVPGPRGCHVEGAVTNGKMRHRNDECRRQCQPQTLSQVDKS